MVPPVILTTHGAPAVAIPTTTETVILTITGITTRDPSEPVTLLAYASVLVGTGGTAVTFRLRRGTTTAGTQVGDASLVTGAAGATVAATLVETDTPGAVSGASYSVTAQQTAATGSGTGQAATITTIVGG